MREVIFDLVVPNYVKLDDLALDEHIWIYKKGKLLGLMVEESDGWIAKTGLAVDARHYPTRLECLRAGYILGYTFKVDM